ncbi:MAG: hypothetical protein KKE17_15275 [Proteobacteria bacterium]|nr:hypothetical protein [Pseudomonadota bacterium]MBU1711361.1 hypothetical protein [Pseudomonadota bacterium]
MNIFLSVLIASTVSASPLDQLKDRPASIRGENLKVSSLLRAIGRQAEINFFVADNIDGTITIDMDNLTMHDIFHVIITAKQLHYTVKDNVVYIEKLADFEKTEKDVVNETLCTNFGNAAEYIPQLKPLSGKNGSITSSNRGNCILVKDREDNIRKIEAVLKELDTPLPQVHIEAKIVSSTQEARRRLGIKWGYDNLSTRNPLSAGVDLSVTPSSSDIAIGFIRDNLNLNIDLLALQEKDMLQILSAPSILVIDGKEAEIKQGKEVPYVVQSGDLLTTSFREANLSLKVTPKIIKDSYIVLDVNVTNDSVDQSSAGGEPLINKQEITTNLFLEDKVTVVIGGILLQTTDNQDGSVPGLSRIPLLGNLFKNSEKNHDKSELLVFITPTIVNMQAGLPKKIKAETYKEELKPHDSLIPDKSNEESASKVNDDGETAQEETNASD